MLSRAAARLWLALSIVMLAVRAAGAQTPPGHADHVMPANSPGWTWGVDAEAFADANLQERKFRDIHRIESQNWFMLAASRALGRARLDARGMLSGEAYTLHLYGSPQVFQTGETYNGLALIDYQHPHDVIMGASARLEWPLGSAWRMFVDGGPVGSPAIGPAPFMHRPSAGPNPTAPLSHHSFDSTHITHGVITLGLVRGPVTFEASAFHGREPDEDRLRVEFGPIDSYAARVAWQRGAWHGQVSGAHIKFPSQTEFTDAELVNTSVDWSGRWRGRPLTWLAAFGLHREPAFSLTSPAVFVEGTWQQSDAMRVYVRGEWLRKDILTLGGYDPPGFNHPHILSTIGALTVGYERRLTAKGWTDLAVGADATGYYRDPNLDEPYGHPWSFHVFFRFGVSNGSHAGMSMPGMH